MTLKTSIYFIFAAAVMLALSPAFRLLSRPALAHPGRTDSSGGHYCRTNCGKWGLGQDEYHKHNAGGYTNSKGQTFDKAGNPVSGTSADKPASSPTPPPAAPAQAQQPAPAPVKAQTPTPTPTEQGEVLGIEEEATSTPEPSLEEPSPTPTPSLEATSTPEPIPTPESESENEGGGGAAAATLGTLAVLGGGGYYLFRRLKSRRAA
ncbi:MAG: hypothetical protein HY372_01125 [Candidatus Andersenbacteria bacterium]|nr:hypothetical protein [Candidatus Andersenbacteria bacterium]